jgi:hypothetical protein
MRKWHAITTERFDAWFAHLAEPVKVEIAADVKVLQEVGPRLGRPLVDTLKGSRHANMKELRTGAAGQVVRIAFAFDPERTAILLLGGTKQGRSEQRFYRWLIEAADALYDAHLAKLAKRRKGSQ